jgi:hypothetical protein
LSAGGKIAGAGAVLGIQPRVRLIRSLDPSSQRYQGFVVRVAGKLRDEGRAFVVTLRTGARAQISCGKGSGP